jgi:hypothetical protein
MVLCGGLAAPRSALKGAEDEPTPKRVGELSGRAPDCVTKSRVAGRWSGSPARPPPWSRPGSRGRERARHRCTSWVFEFLHQCARKRKPRRSGAEVWQIHGEVLGEVLASHAICGNPAEGLSMPIGMVALDPIPVMGKPPGSRMPMVMVIPVAVLAPGGICPNPLRMMLRDPVRIVVKPPVRVMPLVA